MSKGPIKTLEIRSSPHVVSGNSVETIMWNVVLALMPVTLFAIVAFGLTGLITLLGAVGSCVFAEHMLTRNAPGGTTIGDGSAVITGLLFGLVLPPAVPLWIIFVGGFLCMGLGKWLFGGLGANPFNPALVGRAVLQAAFPIPMTTWNESFADNRFTSVAASVFTLPFSRPSTVDAISAATPLSAWKFDGQATEVTDLLLGMTTGSAGETCAVLILLGGAWLVARNMMNWRIPLSIFVTAAVFGGIFYLVDPVHYPSPLFTLFSGGLMLGAVFMATDMVGSPMTNLGCVVYGALIALLTVSIRLWGGMPEGMMYAILLGNAAAPHIDSLVQPRVFGTGKRGRADVSSDVSTDEGGAK